MAKKIELTHAEIITKYDSSDVLTEIKTDKGTILSWNVKTRVNDRNDKSPVIFDSCSLFTDDQNKLNSVKQSLVAGTIVDIKGYADRRKGKKTDSNGKPIYFDNVNVKEIIPITGSQSQQEVHEQDSTLATDDDLPF